MATNRVQKWQTCLAHGQPRGFHVLGGEGRQQLLWRRTFATLNAAPALNTSPAPAPAPALDWGL